MNAAILLSLSLLAAPAPLDTMVTVGDHALHFVVHRGTRPATVVLEAGGAADLTSWGDVPARVAARTGATVVAYDRAGLGGSGLPATALTPEAEVRDLRAALDRLAVPDATVLVGHSYGAMLALLHAGRFPERVVGLVMVDPMNPRFIRATGDFVFSTVPTIPNPTTDRERVIARMVATFPALIDEVATIEPALRQPMVVITAGEAWWGRPEVDAAWRAGHAAMAAAAPGRRLVVADGSDHDVPDARPELIVDAVESLLAATGAH